MAERIRVGVVGVGALGSAHARVYAELPSCQLMGIYDIDDEKNRRVGAQYSLPIRRDLDDLLEVCEAVSIVTPTDTHCNIAMRAIGRRRHIFVEKPVASSIAEAEKLIQSADARGITAAVGHIERFNPAFLAVRDELGEPRFIEAHRLNRFSPRGLETAVILELMIHDIDLILSIVDSPITEIRAAAVPVVSDTDDIANCRLQFANGCVANLTASRISAHPLRKIRVFTRDRYASLDLKEKSAELFRLFRRKGRDVELPSRYRPVIDAGNKHIARLGISVAPGEMLVAELDDFISAIKQKKSPRVSLTEAARALGVALDIVRAAQEHRRQATLPPPPPPPPPPSQPTGSQAGP